MSADLADLDNLPERFAQAWNRHDVEALFESFAPDADFIDTDGMLWHGRESIAAQHDRLLRGKLAGSMLRFRTVKVRKVSRASAIVFGIWSMTGHAGDSPSSLPVRTGLWVFVLSRSGGAWSIVASQATEIPR